MLVTTSTRDNQPIELAAALVRDRGRVVCLGNTHIELDWRTWFGKEIDFLFSRAMGAGMFDPDYLMRGKDYPIGYVRWTANRNMQAFLDLIAQRRLDLAGLITHRFPFAEAIPVFDQHRRAASWRRQLGSCSSIPSAEPRACSPRAEPRTLDAIGRRVGSRGAGAARADRRRQLRAAR